jgi:YfiH family protein
MSDSALLKIKEHFSSGHFTDENFICTFSNRHLKNMSLFYGDTSSSLINRNKFLEPLGIDYQDLICAKQIHSNSVRYAREQDKGRGALSYDTSIRDTDALITDERKLPLAVFTADCLSIFLYDPKVPAIGLIHAGWRSTKGNITIKTIQLMQELFMTDAASLLAGFGPAIRSCCYEIDKDFNDFFPGSLIERNNRYYLDLVRINKKQLLDLGIKEKNIIDSGICTSCRSSEFFSYRKEGKNCGRMMSVIMLR